MPTVHRLSALRLALALIVFPGTAAAQARSAAPVMELPALLEMFLITADAPAGAVLPWDAGTGPASRVRWAFTGTAQAQPHQQREGHALQRVGHVAISIRGEPAYRMMHQQRSLPGAWRVTLLGLPVGAVRVEINSEGDTAEMEMDVPQLLTEAGWKVAPLRCSRETSPAVFGQVVHVVEAPGRRPAWLLEGWDYGAATGMRVAVTILHRQDDADSVECITR